MVRSIPEKTFEHWASMYVTHRFPNAALWWPTKGEDITIDDLGTVPGKSFFIEAKVPEVQANGAHQVTIDLGQLQKYMASLVPVYYTFPVPPWTGDLITSGWLGRERRADLAFRRTQLRWFGNWTVVCSAADLHAHLTPSPTAQTAVVPMPLAQGWDWTDFWTLMRDCGSPDMPSAFVVSDPPESPTRAALRDILGDLRRAEAALRRRVREQARDPWLILEEEIAEPVRSLRDQLADREQTVFVPDRSSRDDVYRRVTREELAENMRAVVESMGEEGGTQDLSVCSVPYGALAG